MRPARAGAVQTPQAKDPGALDGDEHVLQAVAIEVGQGREHDLGLGAADGMAGPRLGLCRSETLVIPGHGPLANCADLESYGQMLADTSKAVRELLDQGKSLEEIIAARPNKRFDERYGQGFIKPDVYVKLLHASLTASGL